jgi:hypothetical protein
MSWISGVYAKKCKPLAEKAERVRQVADDKAEDRGST